MCVLGLPFNPIKMLCVILIILLMQSVQAHNVVAGAYAEGMLIEGEIGFSNGDMAEAGSLVKVFNANGDLLDELKLEDGGVFTYTAKSVAKHVFKSNLSAGHVTEIIIEAEELSGGASVAVGETTESTQTGVGPDTKQAETESDHGQAEAVNVSTESKLNGITAEQLQSMIRSAVAQQVKPLQKELRAYKEKVMFRDIAGGLGFIFGLFGVAAWAASRRNHGDKDATVS